MMSQRELPANRRTMLAALFNLILRSDAARKDFHAWLVERARTQNLDFDGGEVCKER